MDSVCRNCRREGMKLFLKGEKCFTPKCPVSRRAYPPGVHGPKGAPKPTEYGTQLREKQKAKRIYGVRERQFRNYVDTALGSSGNTADTLLATLERRLDAVVYRAGFAVSHRQARQLVAHGHFAVDGQRVTIPSYLVHAGAIITVVKLGELAQETNVLAADLAQEKKGTLPAWLRFDSEQKRVEVLRLPAREDIEQSFDPKLIIEFYSR